MCQYVAYRPIPMNNPSKWFSSCFTGNSNTKSDTDIDPNSNSVLPTIIRLDVQNS